MRGVLVDGGDVESEFGQDEGRAGYAGRSVVPGFASGARQHWLFIDVAGVELLVGEELHVSDGGDGFGVGLKVEEALPHHVGRSLDVENNVPRPLSSHPGLFLDAFALLQLSYLVLRELRQAERERLAKGSGRWHVAVDDVQCGRGLLGVSFCGFGCLSCCGRLGISVDDGDSIRSSSSSSSTTVGVGVAVAVDFDLPVLWTVSVGFCLHPLEVFVRKPERLRCFGFWIRCAVQLGLRGAVLPLHADHVLARAVSQAAEGGRIRHDVGRLGGGVLDARSAARPFQNCPDPPPHLQRAGPAAGGRRGGLECRISPIVLGE
mmetsp:Transcript_21806/g.62094  ORF Transcript_21806/g.62094 Transcript_21806/m.62094 type:complete len:319 (+) Transcript_21806:569-1525(+)